MSELAAGARYPGDGDLTSVVIVAADSGPGLTDCIAGVLQSTVAVDVIVVDNASGDGSIAAIAGRWADDRVRIVRNARNLGFGAGCNRGAALARGSFLLFLNPDCELDPDTIARARSAMTADIGLLGVAVVDANGKRETAARRRDPLLRHSLMSVSGLARFQSRCPSLAGVEMAAAASTPPIEPVDAISGALMLLPRALFERLGGFDEGYFLHAEDLDLCRRVRDSGLTVACANEIEVRHGKGGSSRHRPLFVAWHKHRGMWRWFTKFDPAARNPLWRAVVGIGLALHLAVFSPFYAWRQLLARTRRQPISDND